MDEATRITIEYLVDTAKSDIDLKWKLKKYLYVNPKTGEWGDLSFLGHAKKALNNLIAKKTTN